MLGDTQWLWLLALVGGPILLGLLMARGVRQTEERRKHDPAGIAQTERATRDLYEEEEHRGEAPIVDQDPTVDPDRVVRRQSARR